MLLQYPPSFKKSYAENQKVRFSFTKEKRKTYDLSDLSEAETTQATFSSIVNKNDFGQSI